MPEPSHRAGETSTPLVPAGSPTNINGHLPEDLLELVLLHASSVCLLRAAATCKLWRRVIAGGSFLRRFALFHPPHVFGHYYGFRTRPSFVPSPMPTGEAAVDDRGRGSLDFLGHHYSRRYGTLELSDGGYSSDGGGCSSLLALVEDSSTVLVCDPWTRQHRKLTPLSPWKGGFKRGGRGYSSMTIGAFLLAGAEDDDTGCLNMSCFKLLCVSLAKKHGTGTKTVWATMYSARDDRWISLGSRDISTIMRDSWRFNVCYKFLGRCQHHLCWSGDVSNAVLHLDESSGVFSTFTLPADASHDHPASYHRGNLRVVGGGSGYVLLARILDDDLEVLRWSRGGDNGGHECVVERKVCLSHLAGIELKLGWSWRFLNTAETVTPGHVVLLPHPGYKWMFSVNVETMALMRSEKRNSLAHGVFPYHLPWPPTIKVCV